MDIPSGRKNESKDKIEEDIVVKEVEEPQVSEIDRIIALGRRPFEIILKGGAPWGFALNGGKSMSTPLYISKIVAGSKASESALTEGDYILRVNDVACADVGYALDMVDAAVNTLRITVLRGHVAPTSEESPPSLLPYRSVDLHGKVRNAKRYNDDSVVYSQSKSQQRDGGIMRAHKRRGDSFNVGQINSAHAQSRSSSIKGQLFEPQQSTNTTQGIPSDTNNRRSNNDHHRLSSPLHQKEKLTSMNRRRSDGPSAHSSVSSSQRYQSQHMSSSPNLADNNTDYTARDPRLNLESSREHKQFNSSPNLLNDIENGQRNLDRMYGFSGSVGPSLRQDKYLGVGSYAFDTYASDVNSSRVNVHRSIPAHNLQRYQPDYENISVLGSAQIGSEKISEIDDIDEVTGRDSLPHTPDVQDCDPLRGAGLPTRDPASLKYIKVNQNHEKYPSWPVTKPNGATEQTQPINTRAQSMTDHSNTSKEFPNKQQLAYTPGLRPLVEKNSPTAERKTDDGKARNSSDPGLKSEFVYGPYGRVERRNVGSTEGRFDEFYNNSKPGYPPPNMDPDGHNIGDKEYNAPSPPERDSKGVDQTELSRKLWDVQSDKTKIHEAPNTRPSNLRFHTSSSQSIGISRANASTSPLNKGSPVSSTNQKNMWAGSQSDGLSYVQGRQTSFHDQKQSSALPAWHDKGSHSPLASPNSQSQGPYSVQRSRPHSQKDQPSSQNIPRDRPSSQYDRSSNASKTDSSNLPRSGEGSKTYIVKSTPYYNTSTQTDMIPYAIKVSDPTATKSKNAESQVDGLLPEGSPKVAEDQRKLFEEKSIQARMSQDFENSEVEIYHNRLTDRSKEQGGGIFRYPSTVLSTNQASPFKGIQSIQAKYATDELDGPQNNTEISKRCNPNTSDNASILRKLSEEFYRSRLGMVSDKRMSSSSSSQESPKYDSTNLIPAQQVAMSETGSYSSVIIHHDQRSGPFGRDEFGSVSSIADSRHDLSLIFSDTSSNYKNIDLVSPRGRRSLDPSFSSQHSRVQHYDQRIPSGITPGHTRELSAPVSSVHSISSCAPHRPVASVRGKVSDQTSLNHFETPSGCLDTKSFSSDSRSSQSKSNSSSTEPPFRQVSSAFSSTTSSNFGGKHMASISGDQPSKDDRSGSDSVFIGEDDKEGDDLAEYEFNRKPSMRKAYGIYDETEKLISQSRLPTSAQGAPEHQTAPHSEPSQSGSSTSRMARYSESLGNIQEESDSSNPGIDFDHSATTNSAAGKTSKADEQGGGWKPEKLEKYPWQNEAWLKSNVDVSTGSNLRRTTSEQIAFPKQTTNFKVSSYDMDLAISQPRLSSGVSQVSASSFNSQSFQPRSDASFVHSRNKSGDVPRLKNEAGMNNSRHQVPLRYHEPQLSGSQPRTMKDGLLEDPTVYESVCENPSSPESVTEVISKVNENLAKSARRVDSIRRSNSSSSRNSSDYVDMSRERNRKETDWSRLRSSASMRYSPDHDRRSSRSSFASENLYEDISMFSPSTPRSSYADSSDRVLEPESSNASMDSGLVASPTYQNLPYHRRPPPPPPRSPSPEETPPALPPRKYKEGEQLASVEKAGKRSLQTTYQNPSMSPTAPSDSNNVSEAPLTRPAKEDIPVDRSKRDFKSLMSQWESNSPREDIYTAELRKQAKKLSGNQQQPHHQQVSAIPAAYERTKTKINFSTTFKHEPMQPQEATSPVTSSSAFPTNVATTSSSSSGIASVYGASPPRSSSSSSPMSTTQSVSKSYRNINTSATSRHDGDSVTLSYSTTSPGSIQHMTHATNTPSSVKHPPHSSPGTSGTGAPTVPPSAPPTAPPRNTQSSNTPQKMNPQKDTRNRSGSDGLQNKLPVYETVDVADRAQVPHRRERSSSEHDILSDRRQKHQVPHQQVVQASIAKDGASSAALKWRPGRASAEKPPTHPQARSGQLVEIVSMKDGGVTSSRDNEPAGEDAQGGNNRSMNSQGFADESYIGHKNKTSRAIGTYKRSKSVAVLQSGGSSVYDGDEESRPFQELGQQTWNSESVLTHTEAAERSTLGVRREEKENDDRVGPGLEYPDDTSRSVPTRPARSGVHGRYSLGQLQTASTFSSSPGSGSQNSHAVTATSSGSVNLFAAKPFVSDQPASRAQGDSHRQVPATLSDPAYNPISPAARGSLQDFVHSTNGQHKPGASSEGRLVNSNNTLSQNTPAYKSDISDSNNKWNIHNNNRNNVASTLSPSSSHDGKIQSNPADNGLPRDTTQHTSSHTDYHRRESAPIRSAILPTNSEKKLDVPLGDSAANSRRRSDSSLNHPQQTDLGGYEVSVSHSRQPSQEELECDEKAKQLAHELEDKEHKLSEVLRSDSNKKRMQYMDGLFSNSPDLASPGDRSMFNQETRLSLKNRSAQHTPDNCIDQLNIPKRSSLPKEYWMSPSKAMLEMELRKNEEVGKDLTKDINDSSTLMKHKEELMQKLHKKLEVLKEEKVSLQQEITDNNLLGKQVCQTVDAKCQNNSEKDKFKTYIDDLEKIVRLLLNLSGQLARAENAVQALGPQVDSKLKKLTIDKRERLFAKHEEAKFLKEDIDKRNEQLSGVLRERLTDREFTDYTHFIKMKSKLTIELQELDDKITLGEEQILELKKSIPDQTAS